MEQTVAERPLSQQQRISQLHMQHNGKVNSSDAHSERDPLERWCLRRSTGGRGTIPSDSFGGDNLIQHKVQIPVCRDNLRGSCVRGAFCKYKHSESDEHDRSKYFQNEREKLGSVVKFGYSQVCRANEDIESTTRISSRGYRSRSPCRKFQSGRCYRGASCPYLHPEMTDYDRLPYGPIVREKQVDGSVRDPGSGEADRENTLRMSQERGEADEDNTSRDMALSRESRGRSPCRNFLRGNCRFGALCRRWHPVNTYVRSRHDVSTEHHQGITATSSNPGSVEGSRDVTLRTSQEHGEATLHNRLRTGTSLREPRNRSPCQNFISGKCYRGSSCMHLHPVTLYDRTRYDLWSVHQHHGASATSGTPHKSSSLRISHESKNHGIQQYRDMHAVFEQNKACSTKDGVQLAGNGENIDVTSGSWSYDRQRSRSANDFGGDKLTREVCLQFTKGRCNRGELCRYLHGYHQYATSNWSEKSFSEDVRGSRNFGVANQNASTMMAQEHADVKNYKMSFGESRHIESSQNGCFDKETQGVSVAQENIASFCTSTDKHGDISLWSRPFNRQRSRSRSPSFQQNDFSCRKFRRYDSRTDLHGGRCYNVARFQYPDGRSYTYEKPMYHGSSQQRTKGGTTAVNPCPHRRNVSKLVTPQMHDEVVSQGSQLDKCPNGIGSTKNEGETAVCALQHRHTDKIDEEVAAERNALASSGTAAAVGQGLQLDQCPPGSLGSSIAIGSKKNEAESAGCALQPSLTEQKVALVATSSIAAGSKERVAAMSQKLLDSDSTSSFEEQHIFPVDMMMNALTNNDLENALMHDHPAKQSNIKKRSRQCKQRSSESASCEEIMEEEVTDALRQGMPITSLVETSRSNPNTASVSGIPVVDLKMSASNINKLENGFLHELPVKPEENGSMTNKIEKDVEPALASREDDTSLVTNNNSLSMEASQSLSKSVIPIPGRKLLVIDLNGILADIAVYYGRSWKPDTIISGKGVFKRPFCDEFIQFCFERFNVGIWSSRVKKNVSMVVNFLMKETQERLLFCWDQSHCTATGYNTLENKVKPLVLKELNKLWENEGGCLPWNKGYYNETNTILLDDSPYKALRNPPYTAIFPESYTYRDVEDKSLGPGGDLRVYLERLAEAENVQKFIKENPFGQRPITKGNASWGFYAKIVSAYASPQENANTTPNPHSLYSLEGNNPAQI